ncbi:MAG TPA: NAD(P)H-dependent oxidoreductase subunit E [Rhodanobacter sp.]|jgi:formate dehydrogenase|nr:NAD(P)H-dependent oxidoreductase subunit E [Rhodanobacter sp.]
MSAASDAVGVDVGPRRKRKRAQPKGRQADPESLAAVREVLGDMPRRRDMLLEGLHRINDRHGCLRLEYLTAFADELRLSLTEVYEVASFYHHFDIVRDPATHPPALTVRVCDSVTCSMCGADELVESLQGKLGANVRIQRVPCVGRCADAPVAVCGQKPVPAATAERVAAVVTAHDVVPEALAPVTYAEYRRGGGYATWVECATGKRDRESVIKAMEDSSLRGLGGAGFPAGRKWRLVGKEPGLRVVAINIDEGEPGTFKDRYFLERDPHRFLEGTLIAAWAIGSHEVYLYIRDEYPACRLMLEREIAVLQADPPAALPAIYLRRGAGAYIAGEESAMIESIEGRRAMPRLRPPYVAQNGLFGLATLEHNMETMHWVRDILEKGGEWFASQGRHGRKGMRTFSVSGRVRKPGVCMAPAGITLRELIDEYCGGMQDGHELYGYFPGGASGGLLPAWKADLPLDFDTLQPHGCFIGSAAIIVFSRHDKARELARNAMRFFSHESCGQCTPCRVGTVKATELMGAEQWDQPLMEDLSRVMVDASICGLGQAAPNTMNCVLKYFPDEVA